jgi:hypothetical protein
MRVEKIEVYIADDGTQFYDKAKCKEYEKNSTHTMEVEARINAVIRLDDVRVKLPVNFSGNLEELSKPEIRSQFLERAWLEFTDTNNSLTANELFKIAEKQGIFPYLDCYEDVTVDYYRVKPSIS